MLLRKSALDLGSCSQIRKRPFCSYFYSAKSVRAGFRAVSTDAGIKGTVTYNNGDGNETVSLKVTSARLSQLSHLCLMWANSPEAEFPRKKYQSSKREREIRRRLFTFSVKHYIRHGSCSFACLNLLLFCCSRCRFLTFSFFLFVVRRRDILNSLTFEGSLRL